MARTQSQRGYHPTQNQDRLRDRGSEVRIPVEVDRVVRGTRLLPCPTSFLLLLIALTAATHPEAATATPAATPADPSPSAPHRTWNWHLVEHVKQIYTGRNSLAHVGAVGTTWLLIESGVDADVQAWAAGHGERFSLAASAPALIGGFIVPLAAPLWMMRSDAARTRDGGLAAAQAVLVSFAATNLLKAVTGRLPPDAETPPGVDRRSRRFRFGFLRGGVFHGWPSGHTMTNMALAASLSNYYSDSMRVRYFGYGWAAYVMAAATIGDQGGVHWLSDVVAGGLMGWTIGKVVGEGFERGRLRPVAAPGRVGLKLTLNAG